MIIIFGLPTVSTKAYILDIGTYILIFRLGKPALLFSSIDPDWVPSLKLGHDKIKVNLAEAKHRHSRMLERSSKKQKLSISDVADSSIHHRYVLLKVILLSWRKILILK